MTRLLYGSTIRHALLPAFAPEQTNFTCITLVARVLRDPQYLRGLADRQTLVVCRQKPRLLPSGEDAARRMECCARDVGHILAPQRELDRRPVDGAVAGLAGKPQHGVGDPAFGALGRKLAHPLLHLLQAPPDDTDDVDPDLRVAMDQVEQFGLAPARLQRFGEGDRVGGVAAVGEQRNGPEHFAGPDKPDDDLSAVAAGLGDAHATLDDGVGAHAVIALTEDAKVLGQPPHARAGSNRLQGGGWKVVKKLHRCSGLWRKLGIGHDEGTLPAHAKEGERFALAQTPKVTVAINSAEMGTKA